MAKRALCLLSVVFNARNLSFKSSWVYGSLGQLDHQHSFFLVDCRDRKRKKFVSDTGKEARKKLKTESGGWISSSYKSNAYQEWMEQHKMEGVLTGEEQEEEGGRGRKRGRCTALADVGCAVFCTIQQWKFTSIDAHYHYNCDSHCTHCLSG